MLIVLKIFTVRIVLPCLESGHSWLARWAEYKSKVTNKPFHAYQCMSLSLITFSFIISDDPTFSIDHMVSLLRQENAKDICVIQLPPEMRYSDYFIIVSGSSTRHLQAMAQYFIKMYKFLKTDSQPHVLIEGKDSDSWMCIDFGNIVVHFMLPETREIYDLEKLWTLRVYDDQLTQMIPESIPEDFIFGMHCEEK